MKFFKRKKQDQKEPTADNTVGRKLMGYYNKLESGWAEWMAQRTAPLTNKDLLIALIVFVLVTGGYSGYLIISGFSDGGEKIFSVSRISSPAAQGSPIPTRRTRPGSEYENIKLFHRYMDSLNRDSTGKKLYDSIIRVRPGLMDSITQAEKYYQQLKTRKTWKKINYH